jgi:site-specific DNA recombinase
VKRAVLYGRVSTEDQSRGFSLETQLEACRKYARQQGYQVVEEIPESFSGRTLDRPGLQKLLRMVQDGLVDAVIAYSPDRLSRDIVQRISLRAELQASGIKIYFVSRGEVANNPSARFVDNIDGVVAEYEVEQIRERTSRGRRAKAENGQYLGQGYAPPFGYRKVGTQRESSLEIDEAEAEIVRWIFRSYLDGVAVVDIIEELNKRYGNRGKPSGWKRGTIYYILRNSIYMGDYYALRHTSWDNPRPKDEQVLIKVAPIISEIDYELAQARLQARTRQRVVHPEYVLRGHIKCECGYGMHPLGNTGHAYRYYRCLGKARFTAARSCDLPAIRAEVVEEAAWTYSRKKIGDIETVRKAIAELREGIQRRHGNRDAIQAEVEQQLKEIDEKIEMLLDLYTEKRLPRELLEKKVDGLKNLRQGLAARLPERPTIVADPDVVERLMDGLRDRLDTVTPDELPKVYDIIRLTVKVHADRIVIGSIFGEETIPR